MNPLRILPPVLLAACAAHLQVRAVELGDSEEKVLAELGKPTARVAAGGAVLLTFPRGTVRIANGGVTAIELVSSGEHQRRVADEAARREAAALAETERNRARKEEGERIRAERETDAAFQALPPRQRVAFWRQFMSRFPGVPPGSDYTAAALQIQAEDEAGRKAAAEEKRLRDLEARVARAEDRAAEAERKLERQERRIRSGRYYGFPYYYYTPVVPLPPKPEPRKGGPTIVVNGFEQFQSSSTTNKVSVGFGVRPPDR